MRSLSRLLHMLFWTVGVALAVYAGHAWWRDHVQPFETTDNAYVRTHLAQISPRITGYIQAVHFTDNQRVEAGQLLIEIDGSALLARRDQAAAEVAASTLRRATLETEQGVQNARIAQHLAAFAAVTATVERAQKDLDRLRGLVEDGSVAAQQRDTAVAALRIAEAGLAEERARADEASSERATIAARIVEAAAARDIAEAALRSSEIEVSHTRIVAPITGIVGNRAVQVGQLAQPGAVFAFLVPEHEFFVEANFKETQLENMRIGQLVEIEIDAYPNTSFTGIVDSTAPASGAEFSILPPENATGNFTKIVRRVPVKIRFNSDSELALLKPGLSTVVKVRVR